MMHAFRRVPFLAASLAVLLSTAAAGAGELRATVLGVKPRQGTVMVALYDSADNYRADRRLVGQMLTPTGTDLTVVFAGLPPGRYGVSAFQDIDGNGKLTTNLLGMPTEPYGFSAGAAASFGPPAFEALAVTIDGAAAVTTEIVLTP